MQNAIVMSYTIAIVNGQQSNVFYFIVETIKLFS